MTQMLGPSDKDFKAAIIRKKEEGRGRKEKEKDQQATINTLETQKYKI